MIQKEICTIISQELIAENVYKMKVKGEMANYMHEPGQFVHIKISDSIDPLLRRPISICEVDKEKNQWTMIYRTEGKGTTLLAQKIPGEKIDVLGPLGNGFPIDATGLDEIALLVGGGIGVPPLLELSKQLTAKGIKVIHVLGFQTKTAVFLEEEFLSLGETHVVTVDGTYGDKGYVTDLMEKKKLQFDVVYSCGPTPMLRALAAQTTTDRVYLSLEERMACGIGACFACVCHTGNDPEGYSYKRVCTEGPVFQKGEVVL